MLLRAICIAKGGLGPWSRLLPAKSPLAFRDPRARFVGARVSYFWVLPLRQRIPNRPSVSRGWGCCFCEAQMVPKKWFGFCGVLMVSVGF
jgi:hypothetical protein